jgi:hypothetical protein
MAVFVILNAYFKSLFLYLIRKSVRQQVKLVFVFLFLLEFNTTLTIKKLRATFYIIKLSNSYSIYSNLTI